MLTTIIRRAQSHHYLVSLSIVIGAWSTLYLLYYRVSWSLVWLWFLVPLVLMIGCLRWLWSVAPVWAVLLMVLSVMPLVSQVHLGMKHAESDHMVQLYNRGSVQRVVGVQSPWTPFVDTVPVHRHEAERQFCGFALLNRYGTAGAHVRYIAYQVRQLSLK